MSYANYWFDCRSRIIILNRSDSLLSLKRFTRSSVICSYKSVIIAAAKEPDKDDEAVCAGNNDIVEEACIGNEDSTGVD